MSAPNPSSAMAAALIDELARSGVDFAVISPGSRSTALALAASAHPGMETVVMLDERSAAFLALGRAKATAKPSVVISTSGTAPANHYPAVIEAEMSCTPLILISADRPAELRGVGANQTIDQVELFGRHVRLFEELDAPDGTQDLNAKWRSTACRLAGVSLGRDGPPGPVHLNIAFREPTVPVGDDGRSSAPEYPHSTEGRAGGGPWSTEEGHSPIAEVRVDIAPAGRGLVIAGDGAYDRVALLAEAARLGWPVLATALSALRGEATVVSRYHHVLASGTPEGLRPDVVVAVGAIGPSPRLEDLVASAQARYRVDWWGRVIDPGRNATRVFHIDPIRVLASIEPADGHEEWGSGWRDVDRLVGTAIDAHLDGLGAPTGAMAASALNYVAWGALVGGSSLPVREIDAHLTRPGPVFGNRGASGIDGFVSTARGVGSALDRTIALSGDLTLLHDSNGLLNEGAGAAVLVVIDNAGGGLFDSLPQHRHAPDYERLFVAAQDRSIEDLARLHRLEYAEASTREALADIAGQALDVGRTCLIRVPVDRHFDLEARRRLDDVASGALNGL